MPWAVLITLPHEEPPGSRNEVVSRMGAALPAIHWETEPPLIDRMKEVPEHLLPQVEGFVARWSESERAYNSTSHLKGYFSEGEVWIEFFGFENEPIRFFYADVRGNGNPIPALAAICLPNGWTAIDFSENKQIDLVSGDASGWEGFRQYRDDAIKRVRESEGKTD